MENKLRPISLIPMEEDESLYAIAYRLSQIEGYTDNMIRIMQDSADLGDARALYALATWYYSGEKRRKNFTKAIDLLKKAAVQGIAEAFFDLAIGYERGKGLTKNKYKAFQYYCIALSLGYSPSEKEIIRCCYYGIGTVRNNIIRMAFKKIQQIYLSSFFDVK